MITTNYMVGAATVTGAFAGMGATAGVMAEQALHPTAGDDFKQYQDEMTYGAIAGLGIMGAAALLGRPITKMVPFKAQKITGRQWTFGSPSGANGMAAATP